MIISTAALIQFRPFGLNKLFLRYQYSFYTSCHRVIFFLFYCTWKIVKYWQVDDNSLTGIVCKNVINLIVLYALKKGPCSREKFSLRFVIWVFYAISVLTCRLCNTSSQENYMWPTITTVGIRPQYNIFLITSSKTRSGSLLFDMNTCLLFH